MDFSTLPDLINRDSEQNTPDLLVSVVGLIRPPKADIAKAKENLGQLKNVLLSNPEASEKFKLYISDLFDKKQYLQVYTETGILTTKGFFQEAFDRINTYFLPQVYQEDDVMGILVAVFHKSWDYLWVNEIPEADWASLFKLIGWRPMKDIPSSERFAIHTLNSILVLSQRIGALGLEPEVLSKMPELEFFESPFIVQNKSVMEYVAHFQENLDFERTDQNSDYKHLMVMLSQCEGYVNLIRKTSKKFGTDLHLSYMLLRLTQNINRLRAVLKMLASADGHADFEYEVALFKTLVHAINRKNSLSDHIEANVNMLAFQITEHSGKTGEHYIANSPKEWWSMLLSAMGGGLIVGFLSIFKVLIYYMRFPPFGETFLYSMNYSFGFIGIHLTHSTLATKQPAMTASKLAATLDEVNKPRTIALENLSEFIIKIFRSQFIAFVGNVLIAFPVAFLIAYGYYSFSGNLIAEEEKAFNLIQGLDPLTSYALFHAAIAGVFLFFSGMISGYYDNKNVYNKIPARIKNQKLVNFVFGKKGAENISGYIDQNLGNLAGNFFLGIFLGSMGTIGAFFGLPLDIQHITFASGNFGLSLVSVGDQLSNYQIWMSVLGIGGIGLMNFLVSFSLAIFVAIKSRKVTFGQTRKLVGILGSSFLRKPHHFFFPIYPNLAKDEEFGDKDPENKQSQNDVEQNTQTRKVRPVKKSS